MSGLDHQNDNSVWRKHKDEPRSSAIMESMQSIPSFCNQDQNFNTDSSPQNHLSLHGVTSMDQFTELPSISDINQSFLLIDGHEYLKVKTGTITILIFLIDMKVF